jgi:hypothetical protein
VDVLPSNCTQSPHALDPCPIRNRETSRDNV